MVADELALSIADSCVRPADHVLDPFCGSGRLLLAGARVRGEFVGLDVNPLACLLAKAKSAAVNRDVMLTVLRDMPFARTRIRTGEFVPRGNRKVEWFSPKVLEELGQIVKWVNSLCLDEEERLLLAAV